MNHKDSRVWGAIESASRLIFGIENRAALGAPASRRLTEANAGDFRISQRTAAASVVIGEQLL